MISKRSKSIISGGEVAELRGGSLLPFGRAFPSQSAPQLRQSLCSLFQLFFQLARPLVIPCWQQKDINKQTNKQREKEGKG